MSDKLDIQQIIDDLDAAEAYVTPYFPENGSAEQARMVESLKQASSMLCRLSDGEVSLLGEVERLEAERDAAQKKVAYLLLHARSRSLLMDGTCEYWLSGNLPRASSREEALEKALEAHDEAFAALSGSEAGKE